VNVKAVTATHLSPTYHTHTHSHTMAEPPSAAGMISNGQKPQKLQQKSSGQPQHNNHQHHQLQQLQQQQQQQLQNHQAMQQQQHGHVNQYHPQVSTIKNPLAKP
jgi:hypothetical protein